MVDVLVTGVAGELGSHFAEICVKKGYKVKGIDITRIDEAWRLRWLGIEDEIEYVWKSVQDLTKKDVEGTKIVLQADAQADRPLGTSAPVWTVYNNLFSPMKLLDVVSKLKEKPICIYPDSCVKFLGNKGELFEDTYAKPTNVYGWTKMCASELYKTYGRSYWVPIIILVTGSCYGPGMRTDQMVAKCIISMLEDKEFLVKSPESERTYTYLEDVGNFYIKLLELIEVDPYKVIGLTLNNGGNLENKTYSTIDVCKIIQNLVVSKGSLKLGDYELGEQIGDTIPTKENSELAYELLNWRHEYTLQQGLSRTISWFKENWRRNEHIKYY